MSTSHRGECKSVVSLEQEIVAPLRSTNYARFSSSGLFAGLVRMDGVCEIGVQKAPADGRLGIVELSSKLSRECKRVVWTGWLNIKDEKHDAITRLVVVTDSLVVMVSMDLHHATHRIDEMVLERPAFSAVSNVRGDCVCVCGSAFASVYQIHGDSLVLYCTVNTAKEEIPGELRLERSPYHSVSMCAFGEQSEAGLQLLVYYTSGSMRLYYLFDNDSPPRISVVTQTQELPCVLLLFVPDAECWIAIRHQNAVTMQLPPSLLLASANSTLNEVVSLRHSPQKRGPENEAPRSVVANASALIVGKPTTQNSAPSVLDALMNIGGEIKSQDRERRGVASKERNMAPSIAAVKTEPATPEFSLDLMFCGDSHSSKLDIISNVSQLPTFCQSTACVIGSTLHVACFVDEKNGRATKCRADEDVRVLFSEYTISRSSVCLKHEFVVNFTHSLQRALDSYLAQENESVSDGSNIYYWSLVGMHVSQGHDDSRPQQCLFGIERRSKRSFHNFVKQGKRVVVAVCGKNGDSGEQLSHCTKLPVERRLAVGLGNSQNSETADVLMAISELKDFMQHELSAMRVAIETRFGQLDRKMEKLESIVSRG